MNTKSINILHLLQDRERSCYFKKKQFSKYSCIKKVNSAFEVLNSHLLIFQGLYNCFKNQFKIKTQNDVILNLYYLHFELIESINNVQTINLDYVLLYIFYDQIQKKLQKNGISFIYLPMHD